MVKISFSGFPVYACFLLLLPAITGCGSRETEGLSIEALPVNAQVEGDLLRGPSVLNLPDCFVWGGSVIKGEDNRYHMFFSCWESGDSFAVFSDGWLLYSKIGYAVSVYPDRDFRFQKIILRGRAFEGDSTAWDAVTVHNLHIRRFGDKYYLYYTGSHDPGPQPRGSKGEHVSRRNRIQQSQCIGVVVFDNFEDLLNGRYERSKKPLLKPRTRVKRDNIVNPSTQGTVPKPDNIVVVNPSVVQRPSDGKYLLYFKGNLWDPNWRGVHGVAVGDTPAGPFKALDDYVFDVHLKDGTIASGEDPYVWYYNRLGKFFVVLKDFSGRITGSEPGLAMMESDDGIHWHEPGNALFMKKQIVLRTGDTLKVSNLERPQLLLNKKGTPQVLYAACSLGSVGKKKDGSTFNVQIRLQLKR